MAQTELQNPSPIIMATTDERKDWERFGELVLADRELHDRLRTGVNLDAFVMLAVELGAERGCVFSAAVVEAVLLEQRSAWLERWL
jgi:hypothetical protein